MSKANFEILEGFLSELLKENITILEVLESESNQDIKNNKFNRLDIKVKNQNQEIVLIEIQYDSKLPSGNLSHTTAVMIQNSPISKIVLDGREFLVKRDELLHPHLAGNKYRKLYSLLQTPNDSFNKIISYGGTQSNAMLAIASMCQRKKWEFIYYTKEVASTVISQKSGNFYHAIELGMQHRELEASLYKDFIANIRLNLESKTYIIDQGGAQRSATEGLKVLADEIRDANLDVKSLATPSGTGTTALYLALNLPEYIVYTIPCIGDAHYLKEQMSALHTIPKNLIILEPKKKYHFAKLYPEFLDIYKRLKKSGIEFDLLYAPAMWLALLEQTSEKIMYIHSGGVTGNESMLERYSRKFSL